MTLPLSHREFRARRVDDGVGRDQIESLAEETAIALVYNGRPHAVIPLSGATHMAAGGVAQRLLRLEVDFLRRNV